MKKLYSILFIFGLLCSAPAFSMQYYDRDISQLDFSYCMDCAQRQKNSYKHWNFWSGFLANLYPYKTWYAPIACNLGTFFTMRRPEAKIWNKTQSDSRYVSVNSGKQFLLGAAAGWLLKKAYPIIAPYALTAVKKYLHK